jgi:heme-degrading monooxygenase HmoA
MFVAIYRWRIDPDGEHDFVANWHRITRRGLVAGSGGSSLFRDAEGCWVAIARWESRQARDHFLQSLTSDEADAALNERARAAVLQRFPDQELDGVLDCWAPLPPSRAAEGC